jgi:predicted dehydrogenase
MTNSRRKFVRDIGLTAAGLAMLRPDQLFAAVPADRKVRLGFIGTGFRGEGHVALALRRPDTEIVAICDVDDRMIQRTANVFKKAGKPMPKVFTGDNYAYHAAEQQKAHVMMLENVCYRRDVMAVLNMVRQNVFGEIVHVQGGYQHDLRGIKFNDGKNPPGVGVEFGEKAFSEAHWRTEHSVHRNGDLYPTHGIGPVAMMIDINRGNRFVSLCSFSSKTRGLHEYILSKGGASHPSAKVNFALGDVVTTNIKCANGETILLQHDTNLPRPYSLGFRVQGTKGLWMDVSSTVYVEGVSKDDEWDQAQSWYDKYDHPLWRRWSKDTEGAGHGGMDFFVLHGFIEAAKRGLATPMDVYDAAAWSAITPLSESSILMGNERVDFPDFTSGQWMYRKNDFARGDDY